MNGQGRMSPVQVGDEIDVKIEAVGEKGDGIAKKDGFVLFVPNTNEGDEVRIRVTKVLRRVGFAEVVGGEAAPEVPPEEPPAEETAEEAPAEEPKVEETEEPADTEDFGEELEQPEKPKEDTEDFGEKKKE